jgi:hypothetical protein
MKSIEFMYWLQGYFEVSDSESLTKEQVQKVRNHLKMAEITEGREQLPFCHWLNGVLDMIPSNEMTKEQCSVIKNKLNFVFDHVVDRKINEQNNIPSNPGLQLNPSESSVLIKC